MARIRTIKPEFPQSESMGRVSRDSRLLFVLLWTICDDEGRCRANSRMLASLLYPYDDDAKTFIVQWMFELEREGSIRLYDVDGNAYLQIEKWQQHQKIDKPSKSRLPSPSERILEAVEKPREASFADLGPRKGPSTVEGTKEGTTICAEPLTRSTPEPEPDIPQFLIRPFIALPTNKTGEEFSVMPAHVDEFVGLYPAVDVRQELRSMRGWLLSNSAERKTLKGMMKFINGWLAREQNKGSRRHVNGSGHSEKRSTTDQHLAGIASLIADERAKRAGGQT